MICAQKGVPFTCVIDPNTSATNRKTIAALGAEVVVVSTKDPNGGYLGSRIAYIKERILHETNTIWLNQYSNAENPAEHARTTARSISENFGQLDYLFVGAGTTGTLMGCRDFLEEHRPDTRLVAVDAVGSVTFGMPAGMRHIPGLGTSQVPPIMNPRGLYAVEMVDEHKAVTMCRWLARTHGLRSGGSTGTVLVGDTYLAHEAGETTNPDSYFLRFPDQDLRRIIALPAALHGNNAVSGIKWIASYPSNLDYGLQRASAVLVLNDAQTGYPFALLEGGQISAARTAASAVLGAWWLNQRIRQAKSLAIVGSGVIARSIIDSFKADNWAFDHVYIHDLHEDSAQAMLHHVSKNLGYESEIVGLSAAMDSDILTFATNAGAPYVGSALAFRDQQIVLNISLRDIRPELVLKCENYFDDVSHCLKAKTSPHLAEELSGNRDFVTGTIGQVIRGEVDVTSSRPKIYSPFGMGILDLALGHRFLKRAIDADMAIEVPNFLGDVSRW